MISRRIADHYRGTQQVSDQWTRCSSICCPKLVPLRWPQREQPAFFDYASAYRGSTKYCRNATTVKWRMQGRITKVLNMKPPEILGMVEEAAGTRMFEAKKQAAIKTIEKKQSKVEEIDKVQTSRVT
jgi:hypothetical protein